eukprot:14819932-Heterocapsa_arctica.AAC.1
MAGPWRQALLDPEAQLPGGPVDEALPAYANHGQLPDPLPLQLLRPVPRAHNAPVAPQEQSRGHRRPGGPDGDHEWTGQ